MEWLARKCNKGVSIISSMENEAIVKIILSVAILLGLIIICNSKNIIDIKLEYKTFKIQIGTKRTKIKKENK